MYMMHTGMARARGRYQSVDTSTRVEGASPHQLVMVLFDELLRSLDAMIAATSRGDAVQRLNRQGRVLAVLGGLDSSLDFDRGGEVAESLALIYREARRLTLQGGREANLAPLQQARAMLGEISSAWQTIG